MTKPAPIHDFMSYRRRREDDAGVEAHARSTYELAADLPPHELSEMVMPLESELTAEDHALIARFGQPVSAEPTEIDPFEILLDRADARLAAFIGRLARVMESQGLAFDPSGLLQDGDATHEARYNAFPAQDGE